MFAAGRMEIIKELLAKQKKIEVVSLVKILNISEATVRRDLEKLEELGFLLRTHGGAVLVEQASTQEMEVELKEEKQRIASLAANLVGNNEIIYIGSGSTCLAFALELKDKRDLTIISNNAMIATKLAGLPSVSIILLGGSVLYRDRSISLVGNAANQMLENMFADKVFLGADGVDLSLGVSYSNAEIANIARGARGMSSELILLCDHTKFGRKALEKLCPLTELSMVVTNKEAPAGYKNFFFEHNIPMLFKYDLE